MHQLQLSIKVNLSSTIHFSCINYMLKVFTTINNIHRCSNRSGRARQSPNQYFQDRQPKNIV